MKRATSIFLLLAMLLALAGCGGGGKAPAASGGEEQAAGPAPADTGNDALAETSQDGPAYTGRVIFERAGGDPCRPMYVAVGDGLIYLYVIDMEGQGRDYLCVLDEDGAEQSRSGLTAPKGSVADIAYGGQGLIWLLTQQWDENGAFTGGQLCRFNTASGQVEDTFDYGPAGVGPVYLHLFADPARRCVYITSTEGVAVRSYDGTELFTAVPDQLDRSFLSWAMTADGRLAAAGDFQDKGTCAQMLDFDGQSFGAPIELGAGFGFLTDGGEDCPLYFRDDGQLYRLDMEAGTASPLLSWADAGVLGVGDAATLSGGRFLAVDTEDGDLHLLEPWQGEGDGPQIVTLGAIDPEELLDYAAVEFNNSQSQYKVVIKDYAEFDNGLEQLGLDIAAGDGPDLLDLTVLPVEQYVRRGYLEDLYPFLDADPDLGREDIDQTMLAAMETDGALYKLIPVSMPVTLQFRPEDLERVGELTWSNILAAGGEGCAPMQIDRDSFLAYAVCGDDSPFMDWQSGTCDFDNGEFRAVLTMAAALPDWNTYLNEQRNSDEAKEAAEAKEAFCHLTTGHGGYMLFYYSQLMGSDGPLAQPGLPGRSGPRYLAYDNASFGMTASAKNKDGAWAFLKFTLDCDTMSGLGCLNLLGEPEGAVDWAEYYQTEGYTEEAEAEYGPAADALADKITGIFHRDQSILDIILDEGKAYFAGDTSVTPERVAAAVQNRASIYMSEQS